jgi:hypothetical protein
MPCRCKNDGRRVRICRSAPRVHGRKAQRRGSVASPGGARARPPRFAGPGSPARRVRAGRPGSGDGRRKRAPAGRDAVGFGGSGHQERLRISSSSTVRRGVSSPGAVAHGVPPRRSAGRSPGPVSGGTARERARMRSALVPRARRHRPCAERWLVTVRNGPAAESTLSAPRPQGHRLRSIHYSPVLPVQCAGEEELRWSRPPIGRDRPSEPGGATSLVGRCGWAPPGSSRRSCWSRGLPRS